jgi:hypothetical protein
VGLPSSYPCESVSIVAKTVLRGDGSRCQTDCSLGQRTLPKYASYNWNRSEDAHPKQCPSRSFPLIFVEAVGKQETDSNPKSNTSASNQSDRRECQTSLFHKLCGCKPVAIIKANNALSRACVRKNQAFIVSPEAEENSPKNTIIRP